MPAAYASSVKSNPSFASSLDMNKAKKRKKKKKVKRNDNSNNLLADNQVQNYTSDKIEYF